MSELKRSAEVEKFLPVKRILLLSTGMAAVIALLHKIGYRGKYHPGGSPATWSESAIYFAGTLIFLFFGLVVIWHFVAWVKKDVPGKQPNQPPEPLPPKRQGPN